MINHFSHTDTAIPSTFDWSYFLSNVLYSAYTLPYIWVEIQESMRELNSIVRLIDSDIQRSQSRSSTSWHNFSGKADVLRNHISASNSLSNGKPLLTILKKSRSSPRSPLKSKSTSFSTLDQLDQSPELQSYIKDHALNVSDVLAASAVLIREASTVQDLEELTIRYKTILTMLKSLSSYFESVMPVPFIKGFTKNPVMAKAECHRTESLIEGACLLFLTRNTYTISSYTINLRRHPDWLSLLDVVVRLEAKIAQNIDDRDDDSLAVQCMTGTLRNLSTKLFINDPNVFRYLMGDTHDDLLNALLVSFMYPDKHHKATNINSIDNME